MTRTKQTVQLRTSKIHKTRRQAGGFYVALYLTYYCEITYTLHFFWHSICRSTWHFIWHSIWHLIWHSVRAQSWPARDRVAVYKRLATTRGGGGPVLLKSRDPTWQVGQKVPKGQILPNQCSFNIRFIWGVFEKKTRDTNKILLLILCHRSLHEKRVNKDQNNTHIYSILRQSKVPMENPLHMES